MSTEVKVETVQVHAERPYAVRIGRDLRGEVVALAADSGAQRVAIIRPEVCAGLAEALSDALAGAGLQSLIVSVPTAEAAKTAEVLSDCWAALGREGFTRSDLVIGMGGGATTDLAGFVAATWLRGVKLITVSTSLLGMVDAAVGGKTGINTATGKNLVGAFWEPIGVFCDLGQLPALTRPDLASGLAEVIKCGFIADPMILDLVERDPQVAADPAGSVLPELVRRAVAVKAAVVSADLRETTSVGDKVGRELLNYGHTLGHAIERREDYRWRHGEAISVGMVFVAELSRRAGHLDEATAARHRSTLASVGLPTGYPVEAFDDLLAAMALDKKTRGSTLRFVILDAVARASILSGPSESLLRDSYTAIAGELAR